MALYSFRDKNQNTVWPSTKNIAIRANINDVTRISKITKSLSSKGWLSKKKRGFTGCNEYKLMVPESAEKELETLESPANLDSDTKLVPDTKSNLDCSTKSNLDSDTKYKEQTIEQTIEQNEKPIEWKKILEGYNEILGGEIGNIRGLTDERKRHVKARIAEDPKKRNNVEWWRNYFKVVSGSEFLTGKSPPRSSGKPWKASFDWLINQNNMMKIIEGKYDNE